MKQSSLLRNANLAIQVRTSNHNLHQTTPHYTTHPLSKKEYNLAISINWLLPCCFLSMNTSAGPHHKVLHYVRCGDTKQAFSTGQSTQELTGELVQGECKRCRSHGLVVSFVIVQQAAASFHPTPSQPVPLLDQMAFCAKPL